MWRFKSNMTGKEYYNVYQKYWLSFPFFCFLVNIVTHFKNLSVFLFIEKYPILNMFPSFKQPCFSRVTPSSYQMSLRLFGFFPSWFEIWGSFRFEVIFRRSKTLVLAELILHSFFFQWLVVLLVLLVMNALWMRRRRSRRRIHRISSIRDAQREVYTREER